jgi:hypothetical protein
MNIRSKVTIEFKFYYIVTMISHDFANNELFKQEYFDTATTGCADTFLDQYKCNFCTFSTNNVKTARAHNLNKHRHDGNYQSFTSKKKISQYEEVIDEFATTHTSTTGYGDICLDQFTCNYCMFSTNNIKTARTHNLNKHWPDGNYQSFTSIKRKFSRDDMCCYAQADSMLRKARDNQERDTKFIRTAILSRSKFYII